MTDQAGAGRPARRTRRQLLAGGGGALAAVLTAEALARPGRASAADGDGVILGQPNNETDVTTITNSTDGSNALTVIASESGTAILGFTVSGDGVNGVANGGGNGVHGENTVDFANGNGVFGKAVNDGGSGVYGQNDRAGFGVAGRAGTGVGTLGDSVFGVGVWANSQNGTALKVTGKANFSRSGIIAVAAGRSSATQTGVELTSASLVIATLQQDRPGVWVRSAVPKASAHSFTVHLSKPVRARTKVAWFVLN